MSVRRLPARVWLSWSAFLLGLAGQVVDGFLVLYPSAPLPPFAQLAQPDRVLLSGALGQLGYCSLIGVFALPMMREAPSARGEHARRPGIAELIWVEWVRPRELAAYLALFLLPLFSLGVLLLVPPSHDRSVLVNRLGLVNLGLQLLAFMYVVAAGRTWLPQAQRGLRWLRLHHRRA